MRGRARDQASTLRPRRRGTDSAWPTRGSRRRRTACPSPHAARGLILPVDAIGRGERGGAQRGADQVRRAHPRRSRPALLRQWGRRALRTPTRCSSRRTTRPWASPADSARWDVSDMPGRVQAAEADRRNAHEQCAMTAASGSLPSATRHDDRSARATRIGMSRPARSLKRPSSGFSTTSTRPAAKKTAAIANVLQPASSSASGARTMSRPKSIAGSMFSQSPPRKR